MFLIFKMISDPVSPLRFNSRGALQYDVICFGWRLLDLIKSTLKLSWCEMTLCLAAIKMNDISVVAFSWCADRLERFIIFTWMQLFVSLLSCHTFKLTLNAADKHNSENPNYRRRVWKAGFLFFKSPKIHNLSLLEAVKRDRFSKVPRSLK